MAGEKFEEDLKPDNTDLKNLQESKPVSSDYKKNGIEEQHNCFICNTTPESRMELSNHLETADDMKIEIDSDTKAKPFRCSVCKTNFARKDHVRKHILVIHNSIQNQYKCKFCGITLESRNDIGKHLETIHDVKIEENPDSKDKPFRFGVCSMT